MKSAAPVFIAFTDLNVTCIGQSGFYGLHFMQCIHGQLPLADGGVGGRGVCSSVRNIKTSGKLGCA